MQREEWITVILQMLQILFKFIKFLCWKESRLILMTDRFINDFHNKKLKNKILRTR
jgi:hypothetical protein